MTCPSFGINASAAAIADCQRLLNAIGLGCSSRWAADRGRLGRHVDHDHNGTLRLSADRLADDTIAITHARRPYAVRPLGEMPPMRDVPPPACAAPIEIANYFHVTNLGTLLDVLA